MVSTIRQLDELQVVKYSWNIIEFFLGLRLVDDQASLMKGEVTE